ncbi:hypothetical protein SAMN05216188_121104 [Lentzea xinjiangensis]|uniref:Uncharacterized protein n=1 Tax=Lentzea xinjiangensis TaxID=402600 RepID=A0A1H9UGQ9_9PSEU|nr:hypothetical protein [Lentzea xinjiangensis]SES08552.1 hypothetical protein SAMN05216188_121104 [Lentzea xinjiangensis]
MTRSHGDDASEEAKLATEQEEGLGEEDSSLPDRDQEEDSPAP